MFPSDEDDEPVGTLPAKAPSEHVMAKTILMQTRLAEAMAGQLSRNRPLKYWENLKLKPQHMQMLLMKASGFRNRDIASQFGMTEARVSVIVNHPDAQEIPSLMVSLAADDVLDINTRIKAHAGEMLDHVIRTTRETTDDRVRSKNALELLKMAGYSGVEKKQVEHVVKIEGENVNRLVAALDEDEGEEIDSYGRYMVLGAGQAVESPEVEEVVEPVPVQKVA